ncbi:hypothetical protein MPH_02592 [Macrophomina phaseolina MS6]|uniref:Uncharacterized protein n=1 Tax=Macrophomina phaseolina (strain MS6) TaxID=1126212 RepID=K2RZD8_MACPH|nr:hypothetical protein MPH_02592 [Macrophomina phaseolina MS6]
MVYGRQNYERSSHTRGRHNYAHCTTNPPAKLPTTTTEKYISRNQYPGGCFYPPRKGICSLKYGGRRSLGRIPSARNVINRTPLKTPRIWPWLTRLLCKEKISRAKQPVIPLFGAVSPFRCFFVMKISGTCLLIQATIFRSKFLHVHRLFQLRYLMTGTESIFLRTCKAGYFMNDGPSPFSGQFRVS